MQRGRCAWDDIHIIDEDVFLKETRRSKRPRLSLRRGRKTNLLTNRFENGHTHLQLSIIYQFINHVYSNPHEKGGAMPAQHNFCSSASSTDFGICAAASIGTTFSLLLASRFAACPRACPPWSPKMQLM